VGTDESKRGGCRLDRLLESDSARIYHCERFRSQGVRSVVLVGSSSWASSPRPTASPIMGTIRRDADAIDLT
jgi:hypothetical protein